MPTGINNFMAINRKANMLGFSMFQPGTDLTWILGTSGGSGSPPTANDLTGQIDGVRTSFAIGGSPQSSALTEVIYNGSTLTPGTDYNVSGSNLNLTFTPQIGDFLYVRYWT